MLQKPRDPGCLHKAISLLGLIGIAFAELLSAVDCISCLRLGKVLLPPFIR